MVFYTGDIHGNPDNIVYFSHKYNLTSEDIVVMLGDVGANYYGDRRDDRCKQALSKIKPTLFCIHGNHERRPHTIPSYKMKKWRGGSVWYEEAYENMLFANDGEVFDLDGLKHLVIGGAYSVDKYYRLAKHYNWFEDEQPSEEIKAYVEHQIAAQPIDIVLSHTCPYRYEPREAFLPMIDQTTVDDSTEKWLDTIEAKVQYMAWLCGHWHINKRIDKIHFLFQDIKAMDTIVGKET